MSVADELLSSENEQNRNLTNIISQLRKSEDISLITKFIEC